MRQLLVLLLAPLAATTVHAQNATPIRALTPPIARSTRPLGSIASLRDVPIMDGLRELPDGRVIVNDQVNRQLLVFDTTLTTVTVLADSMGQGAAKYPLSRAVLIHGFGDSTLFLDPDARSFTVIEPRGALGGVAALPRVQNLNFITNNGGWIDARGGLLYHGFIGFPPATRRVRDATPTSSECTSVPVARADSATLLRADFNTRTVDTITRFKTPHPVQAWGILGTNNQLVCAHHTVHAVGPTVDAYVVTSDGSLATIRGFDYHIEWTAPDGSKSSAPKMAFDWRRLSEADKERRIDSTRALIDSLAKQGVGSALRNCSVTGGGTVLNVIPVRDTVRGGLPTAASGALACSAVPITIGFVGAVDLPDYYPPIRPGTVLADRDGNVWILPTTSFAATTGGGAVYDVVNRRDGLHERVRLPAGRQIAGFGRGGVVYLAWRDASGGWLLERRRVVRG